MNGFKLILTSYNNATDCLIRWFIVAAYLIDQSIALRLNCKACNVLAFSNFLYIQKNYNYHNNEDEIKYF
jgi:hypothetical protein